MSIIKGIDITLYEKTQQRDQQGNLIFDAFGMPVYTETAETVSNVLVGQPSSEDIVNEMSLYGKHCAYVLGIPKGDTHEWRDRKVSFFGETFMTYGLPIKAIESMVPMDWNTKVMVERYE